jgi:centrosomal protein CEP76
MMNAFKRNKVCLDIMECVGDSVRFGIRVKVYTYPEDIVAVWVMLAVKYRAVN